ncbi:MAG: cellulase family glycosylhydrolase [Saprospiraceae bacterium]|nr:cellulase family glycosylhydrolase [Saprospiraceae bacterium]
MHKNIYTILFLCASMTTLLSQPVIYNDNSTLITGTWHASSGGGGTSSLAEVTGQTPHEGARHYRFDYNFSNYWAGIGLNMDNWGGGPARDFSAYTHLRIAYRGLSAGQNLIIQLRNGGNFGNTATIGPAVADYAVVELSLFSLTAGTNVSAAAVRELNISIESTAQSGSGTAYVDAIELVNGSSGGGMPASATTMARAASMTAGVNTSNWLEAYWLLPFNAYPEVNRYTRARVQALRDAGFTTFRLPVTFERLTQPGNSSQLNTNQVAFSLVDSMILWAAQMDFKLIICNHHGLPLTNGNYQTELPRLQAIWTQLAQRYGHLHPDRYFFEVYNEPDNNITNANWRTVATALLQTLRTHESVLHSVFVGAANWNSAGALISFTPLDDADIIYTFHYYEPYYFTHQGMSWTSPPYLGARSFPLAGEMDALLQTMTAVNDWADLNQVPVSMGEFGVATSADADSRCNWVNAVMNAVNTYGFSYFYWDAISPSDAFGFFNSGVVSEATVIPCFRNAMGLYMAPLAIELLNFDLRCQPGRSTLHWTTMSDELNARFELQRSTDARTWHSIHAGSTASGRQSYSFTDEAATDGALYRLRSISADGSERFSPVRIATCGDLPELKLWPNPARDEARLQLSGDGDGILRWSLWDMQGRLVMQSEQYAGSGRQEAIISPEGLPAGMYNLSIQTAKGRTAHRRWVLTR